MIMNFKNEMLVMFLILVILTAFIFCADVLPLEYIFSFHGARRIRGKDPQKPMDILKEQGYYIKPQAQEKIKNWDIKLVSFDWGGVLSSIVSNERMRDEVRKLLSTLKEEGVKVTIVTEGDVEAISRELKDLNLRHYFDGIYESISNELAVDTGHVEMTKGEILSNVGEDYNLKKDEIISFEDEADYIQTFNYKGFHTVGVVGRAIKDSRYEKLAKKMLREADVTISHLGIGLDKILRILNIEED